MKKELFKTIVVFIFLEAISSNIELKYSIMISVFGALILIGWIFFNIRNNSMKKVSKYSEVFLRLEIKQRWFTYIFIPIFLYISVALLLLVVQISIFKQFLIIMSSICFYYLFRYTRLSFEKVFSVDKGLRIIIDMISTILFFSLGLALTISGRLEIYQIAVIVFSYTFISLLGSAYNANVFGFSALIISTLCAITMGFLAILFRTLPYFIYPFVLTLFYYLILSFWHLRIIGEHRLEKYLTPVIFILMALLIVLN